jgi:hypothetical protein
MAKKMKGSNDGIKLDGFFRVQLTEEGKGVIGDSGWTKNQVTNLGINQYVVNWLLGDTGNGKSVTHLALGTGGTNASDATSLSGEVEKRQAVSTSVVSSRTAQFTGQFASGNSFVSATANISNIGLFNTSAKTTGTMFAGNTYASSSCATNQNVNCTYQIRFS